MGRLRGRKALCCLMDASTSARVWERLVSGEQLDGLGLRKTNGRMDLQGLLAPEPSVVRELAASAGDVKVLSNLVVVRGVGDCQNFCVTCVQPAGKRSG